MISDYKEKNKDTTENHQFPVIEGPKETLSKIKENNQKSCFISTKTRESMNLMIKYNRSDSILDFSVSGDEVKNFKPVPEGILKALNNFNDKPKEAIFIGDSLHDLGAARNANVRFLGVLSGICTQTDWELENVSYVPSVKEVYT